MDFSQKLLFGSFTAFSVFEMSAAENYNVVFILVDDLGWHDTSVYGNKVIQTPNIDVLYQNGVLFTDAYSASPVSSPTRAALLTGKSPARLQLTAHIQGRGFHFVPQNANLIPAPSKMFLPLEEVTIAEIFKSKLYKTCFIGKWHLACADTLGIGCVDKYPDKQGFDINVAGCAKGQTDSYFDPYGSGFPNLPSRQKGEYLTDRLTDDACAFIDENRENPFFLYLSFYNVHTPIQGKKELVDKYVKLNSTEIFKPAYAAQVESVDLAVGKLISRINQLGLSSKTIVVFYSDNGGYLEATNNLPLRSGKGHLYEGGIRVPLIISAPNLPKKQKFTQPVNSMDLMPTLLEICGIQKPDSLKFDGISLIPFLKNPDKLVSRDLFWHYPNYSNTLNRPASAIRSGNYKLIEFYDNGNVELYNLKKDISESTDLSKQRKDLVKQLKNKLHKLLKSNNAIFPKRINN